MLYRARKVRDIDCVSVSIIVLFDFRAVPKASSFFCLSFLFPSLTGLVVTFDGPSTTTLSEDTTDEYQLTLITLAGITTGQTATCDINPPQTEFWVKLDPSSGSK